MSNKHDNYDKLSAEISGLVNQTNSLLLNENANKDAKIISTQRDMLAGIVAKHYALSEFLPKDIASAHERGDIHYHDLDYSPFFPIFNCMLIDIKSMIRDGFRLGNAEIVTSKSITTATAVTAQIIAQVASHIYGGNSINNIDITLAPYVTASYNKHVVIGREWLTTEEDVLAYAMQRTKKECYDAFQALEHEVNTLHCANGQTPFCTFGLGLGDTWEARLIQESIFKVRICGIGRQHQTPVFPKLVFVIKEGHNKSPQDPFYDIKQLALECSAKRMYPDILSYEKVVEVTGSFKFPMGCRSFLSPYEENGELVHDGRNNLGVVSLNLPRIAIQSKSLDDFWIRLDAQCELAKRALDTRIDRLRGVKASVAPILYVEGACGVKLKPDDDIIDVFTNGRASISLGYIGLHETAIAMFGNETHIFDDATKKDFSVKLVTFLKDKTIKWTADSGFGFSLYSTPSENLCDRFCRIDAAEFGIIPGVTDKEYYTNSFHLDVAKQVTPFEKIDFESVYPAITSGGFICSAEFPDMKHNLPALETVWDYACDRVPYFATNTPVDECYVCGYNAEFTASLGGFTCPQCGNHDSEKMTVIRRVCGYLSEPNARPFQHGKQVEIVNRVKHL